MVQLTVDGYLESGIMKPMESARQIFLRTQLNDIFATLESGGLKSYLADLQWIEWDEYPNEGVKCYLSFDGQEFYFALVPYGPSANPRKWYLRLYPKGDVSVDLSDMSWLAVLKALAKWSDEVSQQLRAPDLWSLESIHDQTIGFISGHVDQHSFEPFTAEEKVQIRRALSEADRKIREEFRPSHGEADYIRERLDYLAMAIDRLNRFDWKGVLWETGITIAVELALDSVGVGILFGLIKASFTQILRLRS